MLQATDEQHLAFAFQEGRVIVTQDADVLRFHAWVTPMPVLCMHRNRPPLEQCSAA